MSKVLKPVINHFLLKICICFSLDKISDKDKKLQGNSDKNKTNIKLLGELYFVHLRNMPSQFSVF